MSVSDKKTINILSGLFKAHRLTDIVISPGSRNAPLIMTFAGDESFNCLTIVDERSAGFFALGMAQEKGRPVALICTSGSALLNYAPAVAEAFYRNIPLIVVSADRPQEMIDQGDGQTIRQSGALDNHLNYSCAIPAEIQNENESWYVNRLINEAIINCCIDKIGPVHINAPLREPLYGKSGTKEKVRAVDFMKPHAELTSTQLGRLAEIWNSSSNILIVLGESDGSVELKKLLNRVADSMQAVVLTETQTNVTGENIFQCIDRVISTITEDEVAIFKPNLLISSEGAVVSKMVKTFLRNNPPKYHWQVSEHVPLMDTYMQLTHSIPLSLEALLDGLLPSIEDKKPRYFDLWRNRFERSVKHHSEYLKEIAWSDLKVFELLKNYLPKKYNIHWGNSTVVRYVQLFEEYHALTCYSNRGTSGIDGSVSTAAGACHASQKETLLVTGDLSFLYDSNGLWNNYLSSKLKIIVINNGGGGIFRFIPGPSDTGYLEDYFEAGHDKSIQPLSEMYGLDYFCATNEDDLTKLLPKFFGEGEKPAILEIITPKKENAKTLRNYFKRLKEVL